MIIPEFTLEERQFIASAIKGALAEINIERQKNWREGGVERAISLDDYLAMAELAWGKLQRLI